MPMAENEPSAADQRWLAEYELAMLDEDWVARNVAIGATRSRPAGRSQASSRRPRAT